MKMENLKYKVNTKIIPNEDLYKKQYSEYTENEDFLNYFMQVISLSNKLISENFENVDVTCYGRIKSPNSFKRKYEKKLNINNNSIQSGVFEEDPHIYDIFGFTTIVNSVPDSYIPKSEATEKAKTHLESAKIHLENAKKRLEHANQDLPLAKESLENAIQSQDDNAQLDSEFARVITSFQEQVMLFEDDYKQAISDLKLAQSHDTALRTAYELTGNNSELQQILETSSETIKNLEKRVQKADENIRKAKESLMHLNGTLKNERDIFSIASTEREKYNLKKAEREYEDALTDLNNAKESYDQSVDSLNTAVSNEITDFLTNDDSPLLALTSSQNVSYRSRNIDKPGYYSATHATLRPKNKFNNLSGNFAYPHVEIHSCSILNKQRDIESHNEYKKRKYIGGGEDFPEEEFFDCTSRGDFDKLLKNVPTYILPNGDGNVVKFSDFFNFYYFYENYFLEKSKDGKILHDKAFEKLHSLDFVDSSSTTLTPKFNSKNTSKIVDEQEQKRTLISSISF